VPLGGLPRVMDGRDSARLGLGVMLLGVEADLVAVGVVHLGQDSADAGPVHPGMPLAQRGQPGGDLVDGVLVRHAYGEVVKSRCCPARSGLRRRPSAGPPRGRDSP
jgi:hypothetical protein